LLIVLTSVPAYLSLGHEFMPRLNEGTILYMPTMLPGISVAEASNWLQAQDRVLMTFPEVVQVHGKAGRVRRRVISQPAHATGRQAGRPGMARPCYVH
jgi:copper/silver efflux system protein